MREFEQQINRGTAGMPNKIVMGVRAKFVCNKVAPYSYDDGKTIAGKNITMSAVIAYGEGGVRSDENESWSAATPSGQLSIVMYLQGFYLSRKQRKYRMMGERFEAQPRSYRGFIF